MAKFCGKKIKEKNLKHLSFQMIFSKNILEMKVSDISLSFQYSNFDLSISPKDSSNPTP